MNYTFLIQIKSIFIFLQHKKEGRKVGICGQAPSDYPEFARFLAKEGIDSMSLNPDTVIKTMIDLTRKHHK